MNLSFETSIMLSPPELFTLASLLGGKTLIGIPDPFPGWLSEEIQQTMQSAQSSLGHSGGCAPFSPTRRMECLPCSAVELWQQVEVLLERYFFE